ncbi:hypothetical protein Tco_0762870 [Tanacetum coccineum]
MRYMFALVIMVILLSNHMLLWPMVLLLPRGLNIGIQKTSRSIQLSEHDLIKVEDMTTVVLVKVKEVDTISNMYCICRNEGFNDIKIHYVGGLWVWIQFENEKTCEAFKSNVSLNSLWSSLMSVSPSFVVDERLIWIEISGLPLCAWGSNALKKVISLFGKFKFFDSESDDIMSMGRVCIATKLPPSVSETVSVVINGKTFDVHVKETRIWSTSIINDLDGSDSDDSYDEKESRSSNENEEKTEVLDDFIEQVVEEKVDENPINEVHQEEEELIGMESHSTSGGKPPGFEDVFKNGKDSEYSGSSARVNKCSTFFGNFKSNERKDFCFKTEMNKMIEVGEALGYDVKGCKRSLRKMINGIGVSTMDR